MKWSFTNLVTDLHVCIFFPSSSAHRCLCRSFQAVIFQCCRSTVKDWVFCLVAAFHRCRPTVLSSSHCENNPNSSAHTPHVVSLCRFGCSTIFSSSLLTKAEVVASCKFWHFTVSFLISASVFTWLLHVYPSSVRRLFQLRASVKAKFHCVDRISGFSISEDKNTMQTHSAVSAVFRLSRRLRLASLQLLRCCSVNTTGLRLPLSKWNVFQTTIRIEIKMWKAWTVIKRETPFNCV